MLSILIAYLFCGAFVGLLSGLFGIGGGIIGIPVLLQCFAQQGMPSSLSMHMAIGTMLAVAAATTLSALYRHHKNNMILVPLFKKLAPCLITGSLIGTMISSHISSIYLQRIFAIFLLLVALQIILQTKSGARTPVLHDAIVPITKVSQASALYIGILSSLLGLGGGIILVPYLNWCGIPFKYAIATATACILPAVVVGAVSYMMMNAANSAACNTGFICWPAFLGIGIMSVLFAPIGANLTHRTSARVLKSTFSILLTVVAFHIAK